METGGQRIYFQTFLLTYNITSVGIFNKSVLKTMPIKLCTLYVNIKNGLK